MGFFMEELESPFEVPSLKLPVFLVRATIKKQSNSSNSDTELVRINFCRMINC